MAPLDFSDRHFAGNAIRQVLTCPMSSQSVKRSPASSHMLALSGRAAQKSKRIAGRAIALSVMGMAIAGTAISGFFSAAAAQESDDSMVQRQPMLIAQQLIDGLPPPPPFTPSDLSSFPAPPGVGSGPDAGSDLFMVYVNGSSPLLLEQVRQVQPDALIQEYEGQPIILVGAYDSSSRAEQQIAALENQGISATVTSVPNLVFEPQIPAHSGFAAIPDLPPAAENTRIDPTLPAATLPPAVQPAQTLSSPSAALPAATVSATPPGREIEFNTVPRPAASSVPAPSTTRVARVEATTSDSSYYIVIPGDSDELPSVREQILMLGARQDAVSQREEPLGPHVLVGPFVDRQSASRWNRFLRGFGMNARVYYRR